MIGGTGRRRRRVGFVVLAALAVVAVSAATAAATGFGMPDGADASRSHGALPPKTATVTRQTLTDTQTEDGELGYGDQTTVSDRLGGTVTRLSAAGSKFKRGQALYWVDNTPVVLLYGSLPAYRALSPGTKGADVAQFEQNLYKLGYRGFTVDDEYSASTATAVKRWQGDVGLPKTGTVDLGRVVYAAGPVRVDSHRVAVGDELHPGTAVLTYTGTSRVVTAELKVSDQRLAVKGAVVSVTLPNGGTVPGKIAKIRTVIKPAEGQMPASTKIRVTVTVDDESVLAGLDQATVDVGFTAATRANVLTVPVVALLVLAEGGYGVQVVKGTTTRIVAVQIGLFAGGRVEVSGGGLAEGQTVGIPA